MARKKSRRKSRSAAVYVTFAVFLILLLSILGISVFLRIIEIEVTGASTYTDEEIITASGISPGDNMLRIKSASIKQTILSSMTFISKVDVEFILPDKIRLNVSESNALASISYDDGVLLIDSTGRILRQTNIIPAGLIEIRGFVPVNVVEGSALKADPGDETRLRYMTDVLAAFERDGVQGNVSYLDVTSISNIKFGYLGRFNVVLGTPESIRYKLNRLPDIIADLPKDKTGTINMANLEQIGWLPDN